MRISYLGNEVWNSKVSGRFTTLKSRGRVIKRWAGVGLAIVFALIVAFELGTAQKELVATKTFVAAVAHAEETAPVLARIADCESGARKANGKAVAGSATHYRYGQVAVNGNTNGSVDIGRYQINMSVWSKKANELGLDLSKEADNYKMALWIYENRGTGDWYSSESCWKNV
jgi:hypothetical protein